jgi:hypothetical protein
LGEAVRNGGLGLYRSDPQFNHPPFIVGYIRGRCRGSLPSRLDRPFCGTRPLAFSCSWCTQSGPGVSRGITPPTP